MKTDVIRRNMLWNVIGSTGFIAAQWAMTILIVRLADYTQAGYLSLGLSLTNVFTNVAYFSIRNFQVSDQNEKYTADIYVTHRLLAAIAAFILYAVFVFSNGYTMYVTGFLLLFMLYRLSEPIADVFHGIDQRVWRLDTAGKSFLLRGVLTLLLFLAGVKLTGNLGITTAAMALAAYMVLFAFDIPKAYGYTHFRLNFSSVPLLALTRECFPLFLYAVCLNATVPITRYFLERLEGGEMLGYYSSAAIPASVIQLFASYIFTTFTALFSEYLAENEKKKFLTLFGKLTAAICALVAAALGGSALLGKWALVLLFTESIEPYAYLLLPTVACCGIIAMIWFMGMLLTVLRDGRGLLLGAGAGVLAAAILSYPCIMWLGVDGVNVALFFSSLVTLLWFLIRFAVYMKKWNP